MKATDLKIGNTVKRFGQIVFINSDGIKLLENDTDAFQPVLITDKLLIERGFIYEDGHFYKLGIKLRITLTKTNNAKIAQFKNKSDYNNTILTEKKYMHEIENIFNTIKN
jgi:hypothetical protein